MTQARNRNAWLFGAASAVLALAASSALAQDAAAPASEAPQSAEEIVVTGQIAYRNRVEGAAPVLDYGLDYFQRFEPLTVGDMLKRVPSAAFVSDVLEFDGVRLRGLDPGYTQVLINGERVPGSGLDRSFFVDRIPAELVERVEIIRSPSANRSGDQVAGALNIVLRDAHSFEGAFARAGALHFNDGEIKPVFGALVAGQVGSGRGIAGLNIQGRHNPKEKQSFRFEPNDADILEFDNREDQSDVRDGTDYSFNAELAFPIGNGELEFSGFYVLTDRTETETSIEYSDPVASDDDLIETFATQFEDIEQENFSLEAELRQPLFGGEAEIEIGFARFKDGVVATEDETVYDESFPAEFFEYEIAREFTDTVDDEWTAGLQYQRELPGAVLQVGLDFVDKSREQEIRSVDDDLDVQFTDLDGDEEQDDDEPSIPYPADTPRPVLADAESDGVLTIEERRVDPYVMASGEQGMLEWEAGVRYEYTDVEVSDFSGSPGASRDYSFWLPSVHLRANATDQDRVNLSIARTVRRPNFDGLSPVTEEESPTEENDLRGNPLLEPEHAWGADFGYERRLGRAGVAGLNFFYRDITDLIELASTGETSSSGVGVVLEPRNIGDGKLWGVEFDFSAPLTVFGWENTGVFLNYSLLDSEVTDPVTGEDRRFNNQAEYVLNVGFIQDIPSWAASFGATYRKQGDAFARIEGETVATSYDGDLEVFAEKRFAESLVVRFTASNLLDASKDETFFTWDTVADQLSGAVGEFETETETAGPVFQLVGRLAF